MQNNVYILVEKMQKKRKERERFDFLSGTS